MPTGFSDSIPEETQVALQDVSVCFRLPVERVATVKEFAIRWMQRRLQYRDLWALREVTISADRGEIFGVVGVNGAGKSTLLKVMARVLHPTSGRVITRGSVAPILELGSGFHPELTGRENVFLYGSLLGRTRSEMELEFDDVVDFAELWDFIDAPLRTYSNGMVARLAFAVATARFADVILIDEVLAVGDIQFQEKCLARMNAYRDRGATIVFVSHDPAVIERMCQRAMLISQGSVNEIGPAGQIVGRYVTGSSQTAR